METIEIRYIGKESGRRLNAFFDYLGTMPQIRLSKADGLTSPPSAAQMVMTVGAAPMARVAPALSDFVAAGGAWLHIVGLSEQPLPDLFGVQPGPLGPPSELRLLFSDGDNPMAERLDDAIYTPGVFQDLVPSADDVEIVMYADWHYTHRPMVTQRRMGRGQAACTTLQAWDYPKLQQILYRLICRLSGMPFGQHLGVGILGYAPSVGRLHGLGCKQTQGLELIAACDLSPARLREAQKDFPDIKLHPSGEALGADPDVDLVIVATPPNTHGELCLQMMAAEKHVICEKPLALHRHEAEALVRASQTHGVHLSCHQNRRFDPDYLAIRRALRAGLIGDPFYLETFVGGFSHPCGYWHSHAPVSGGTAYDWGAHYLDWMVSLFPDPVRTVIGTRHKRVWRDVSNADQERIQIRFQGGQEAEFIHSDIAAARKPKWYLLGTAGALVADWKDVSAIATDPDLYFQRERIPATEMPPDIRIFQRNASGAKQVIKPETPAREAYAFHRNLADHLLTGEPLAAPLADSVKVVAILEAAARSMNQGGSLERVHD